MKYHNQHGEGRQVSPQDEAESRSVRFEEIDGFLARQGFERKQPRGGGSHYVYKREDDGLRFTIVRPHGDRKTVHKAAIEEILEKLGLEE